MDPRSILIQQLDLARRALSDDPEDEFHREETDTLAGLVLKLGQWLIESDLLPVEPQPPHPMQPVVFSERGIVRFKQNAIVRFMVDHMQSSCRFGLNELQNVPGFTQGDWEQLHQLIGTSVSTFGDLYANSEVTLAADAEAEKLLASRRAAGG